MGELQRLGRIVNGYSNYLTAIAVDAKHIAVWRGSDDDSDDFERSSQAIMARRYELAIGKGKGIAFDVGGCGSSDVHRIGDTLVMVEHFTGDDNVDAEAGLERAIVGTPTRKPKKLGTVTVESGVLALLDPLEPGGRVDLVALKRGAKRTKHGLMIGVPPGRYDIWKESLGRLEGDWGLIESRVRIVPAGTKVVPGKPIAELPPAPKPRETTAGSRRLVKKWQAITSLAVAGDGRAFAGENGGYRACAWHADGSLAWEREIKKRGKGARYEYELGVQLVRDTLLAHPKGGATLYVLDAATGAVREELAIPATRTFLVTPDGEHLVLRVDTETTILAYPTLERIAHFADQYCNQNHIAVSPDAKWLAVHGHEVHVFDLQRVTHVTTFEPKAGPDVVGFTADNRLLVGHDNGRLAVYEPKTGKQIASVDVAKDRKSKPPIQALAASGSYIAAGREDGTVVVLDAKLKQLRVFDKHEVSQPGTGATTLSAVALAGDVLWVSAGGKGQPIGLSCYALG